MLRMVWVMVLVTARAFRGSRDEDAEYEEVIFDDAEILVPPPQYTMIEGTEAVPVPVDDFAWEPPCDVRGAAGARAAGVPSADVAG